MDEITPATYPAELVAAAAVVNVDPADLLDWAVKKDTVVLILPNGQKLTFALRGAWRKAARKR